MNIETSQFNQKLSIGEKIPYFCLQATDNKIYTPASFSDSKALVVIFTSNHCPYAKLYEDRIKEIYSNYKPKNVNFICICSNDGAAFPEDSFENMKLKDFPFPYLHDEKQDAARAFDAQTTPEVYVFDQTQTLKYHGAVDNNPESKNLASKHYLIETLEAILENKEVPQTQSQVIGCSLKWKINQ